jgi:hypothetical protein
LAVADFNADGRLDVAAANRTDNTVSVILSKPDGTYSSKVDFAAGKAPVQVVSADLNGDHTPDLAVLNNQDDTISILIGKSDGTFQNQVTYVTGQLPVARVVVDLNGDNKLDLAVANQGASGQIAAGGSAFSTTLSVTITPPGNTSRLGDLWRQSGHALVILFCVGLIPRRRWRYVLMTYLWLQPSHS